MDNRQEYPDKPRTFFVTDKGAKVNGLLNDINKNTFNEHHDHTKNNNGSVYPAAVETRPVVCSKHEDFEVTPLFVVVVTYVSYAILIAFGYFRDFLRNYGLEKNRSFQERGNKAGFYFYYFIIFIYIVCAELNT